MQNEKIARRIQQIMASAGITQKGLADYLGISQPAVSLYLRGRVPPAEVLLQIAKLGNTTVEWLLTGENAPESSALQVGEPREAYGNQVVLLKLWGKLPEALQRDLLTLMRHMTERWNP